MDKGSLIELVELGRNALDANERSDFDTELVTRLGLVSETAGSIALEGAQVETAVPIVETIVETTPTPEAAPVTSEGLLATLDVALT
ncbi:MAG TPA: hypothetical protein VNE40_03740, partial [Candidatus Dormibacteraeota bacterium]|nr:hypothetical protein [Candidatus Dormibacteraeota bacterium]